jgi:hypothetical protein
MSAYRRHIVYIQQVTRGIGMHFKVSSGLNPIIYKIRKRMRIFCATHEIGEAENNRTIKVLKNILLNAQLELNVLALLKARV